MKAPSQTAEAVLRKPLRELRMKAAFKEAKQHRNACTPPLLEDGVSAAWVWHKAKLALKVEMDQVFVEQRMKLLLN